MKIKKIFVKNFRLLRNFNIDLEDELSLVIGKNNCGKTSLLSVLDKFLNKGNHLFSYHDFSMDLKKELASCLKSDISEEYVPLGISMSLLIEYYNSDNLSNISRLMMDLNPENNKVLLNFEYIITREKIIELKKAIADFEIKESKRKEPRDTEFFLSTSFSEYFGLFRKTVDLDNEEKYIDLDKENIQLRNIIAFEYISANRDVSNKEPDKSLSGLSYKIYEKIEYDDQHQDEIEGFKDTLFDTDSTLGDIYNKLFEKTVEKVKKFGGIKPDETTIKITSTLQHKDILKGNTTVVYDHDGIDLPESYNGLGYMNLISMIFEIEILVNKFKRSKLENPADINLLFIEEPEAHTHPQMQYVFIKNIKSLLTDSITREDGENRELQYIISTHSSHIVAESNFNDIKYIKRSGNTAEAKNLKSLEQEYNADQEVDNFKFLKQYLTLHRAELFFADKAIFIEGDTERILLPSMMKKIDQKYPVNPMLSQNISIVEVGNYSHIFEKFINFFGIKSLIITDIDAAMTKEKHDELKQKKTAIKQKVPVNDPNAEITTNASLKFFYNLSKLTDFKSRTMNDLKLIKVSGEWVQNNNGFLCCVYQKKEKNSEGVEYHATSFEDSFFHLNRQFIIENNSFFKSLKNVSLFEDSSVGPYELAARCVDKKPPLAIEILISSKTNEDTDEEFINWQIPYYIKEGLLWLKEAI
jgi:predicted ATP-dependent endonuclease of OLD family